jgi:bifunctional DNase/RNase
MSGKIEVEIVSIVPAHSHGAYTLILAEKNGTRKLPVLIGSFEAQAIAMELEGMKPSRPLTHDLIVQAMLAMDAAVTSVLINDLQEGIFFSRIMCKRGLDEFELDSRTSDAIALATKFKCPVFILEHVMNEAAFDSEESEPEETESPGRIAHEELVPVSKSHSGFDSHSMEELEAMLEEAIRDEDYGRAAKIRDEIKKRQ